ncbi:hypothetical protein CRD60_07285 [Bifidobacterium aemilianum]|uniref:Uncharacterized protein n=1 Tax=Bifidobacterium aemilianum TaxID=2493120 RepID=A0A366K6P2_9BIFI|nr:hypothetical protein [Bifidobacterium aemilianum]RBP97334.1 hypothetical protein CRD60_07285 [Bifidobacterium aemilianum]
MLGYNNRIDTQNDELRMDFVLRVAHGDVNPECPSQPDGAGDFSKCRLTFLIAYNSRRWPLQSSEGVRTMRARYVNTLDAEQGAIRWANNVNAFYTIHKVIPSGDYDFLNISLESDIDYPDNATDDTKYDETATEKVNYDRLGGAKLNQYVYAVVDGPNNGSDPNWNHSRLKPPSWDNYDFMTDLTTLDSQYSVNVTEDHPAYVYSDDYKNGVFNGPISYIGWDAHPKLWSDGQANWGLVTDYGFPSRGVKEGVAPANSFFVLWGNPMNGTGLNCSRNTSYYFQWVAQDNGRQWVPVKALTPQALRVDGQPTTKSAGDFSGASDDRNRLSFNAPKANSKLDLLSRDPATGQLAPAQHSDGSIDFAKAKSLQPGLNGYFKLLTWPVTTDADGSIAHCTTPDRKAVLNPDPGITEGMSQADLDARIDSSWTIDTAYYKYDIERPEAPVIEEPAEGAHLSTLNPLIKGSSSVRGKNYVVTLYREDPAHSIDPANPDERSTYGIRVGSAPVNEADGTWQIEDSALPLNTDGGSAKYHAYLTDYGSPYQLSSKFSNIRQVFFNTKADVAPTVDTVTVPHTVDGELPAGSHVTVTGTTDSLYGNTTLRVYAVQEEAAQPSQGTKILEKLIPSVGKSDWTVDVDPSVFAQGLDNVYVFKAVMTTQAGLQSRWGEKSADVDMTPPDPGTSAADWRGVVGLATNGLPNSSDAEARAKIKLAWPRGNAPAQSQTEAGTNGKWRIDLPAGVQSGQIKVQATDASGNESRWNPYKLEVTPPVKNLPMTGTMDWVPAAAVFAILLALSAVVWWLKRRYARFQSMN